MKALKRFVAVLTTISLMLTVTITYFAVSTNTTTENTLSTVKTDDMNDKRLELANYYNYHITSVNIEYDLEYEEYYYEYQLALSNAKFILDDKYAQSYMFDEALEAIIYTHYILLTKIPSNQGSPSSTEPVTQEPMFPTDSEGPPGIISPVYAKLGDADRDNQVTIMDATTIQLYLSRKLPIQRINCAAANVTRTGSVNILDATSIQRKIAGFHVDW